MREHKEGNRGGCKHDGKKHQGNAQELPLPGRLALPLKVDCRLLTIGVPALVVPPRLVPSGMKLMVMSWGFIQALPVAE